MSRIVRMLIVVAVGLALMVPVWGDNAEDIEQVRKVLQKEQKGWRTGDQDMIVSCYAPDFVGYMGWWGRFELANVSHVGHEELRSVYASSEKLEEAVSNFTNPDRLHPFEVLHINVKGDHAVALTSHASFVPVTEERETIFTKYRSLWMLKKIQGEWKITSFVSGVSGEQMVIEDNPE